VAGGHSFLTGIKTSDQETSQSRTSNFTNFETTVFTFEVDVPMKVTALYAYTCGSGHFYSLP